MAKLAGVDVVIEFQSTPSLRTATIITVPEAAKIFVSIHALLAESDENDERSD